MVHKGPFVAYVWGQFLVRNKTYLAIYLPIGQKINVLDILTKAVNTSMQRLRG